MSSYRQDAETISDLVRHFKDSIKQVTTSLEESDRLIGSVAASSEQAAVGTQQISQNMGSIAKATQEVAHIIADPGGNVKQTERYSASVQNRLALRCLWLVVSGWPTTMWGGAYGDAGKDLEG